jgi:hypothetical protein
LLDILKSVNFSFSEYGNFNIFLPWAELKTGLYRWNGDYSQIKNATAGFAIQITPSLNFEFGRIKGDHPPEALDKSPDRKEPESALALVLYLYLGLAY